MSRLFIRDYVLRVDTLEITKLDIAFRIKRTLKREPNKADIQIWNLTPDHRRELEKQRDRLGKTKNPVKVELEAGYKNARSLIFKGDLTVVYTEKVGPDMITHVSSGDGSNAFGSTRVNFSVNAGTTLKDTLKKIGKSFLLGKGNLDEVMNSISVPSLNQAFGEGSTISGSAVEEFSRLAESAGLEWSIQGGVIQVKVKGEPLNQSALLISPDTGLIGSPTVENSAPDPTKTKKTEQKFVKCEVIMLTGMVPGRKAQLKSASFDGIYEMADIDFEGDTRGEKWGAMLGLRPAA